MCDIRKKHYAVRDAKLLAHFLNRVKV